MRPITVLATLFVFLAAPHVARAAVPSASTSSVDHVIISSWNSQGANSGLTPCVPTGPGFDVWVRDIAGNPIPFANVQVVFAMTGTLLRPYIPQGPMVTAHCLNRSMSITADASGHVQFVPHFGQYVESAVVPVYADGVQIALIQARSPDYDCDGDVDLADFAIFSGDLNDLNFPHPRSDFDDCPSSRLGDFAFFAGQLIASGAAPATSVCP